MKVVITGGSGFIGTNLIEYLSLHNFQIINYDINKPKNLLHLEFWKKVDILNKKLLKSELVKDQPEYIIHLAARTDLNETENLIGYDVNITGVENLMSSTVNLPTLKRLIIASSMLVCKVGYQPKTFDDYQPNNLYGESKVFTEKIVKGYNNNWVIIRPTSIWGPWFGEPYFNFFKLVINGLYFNIPEKNASTKTYGYVQNSCSQIYSIMMAKHEDVMHKCFYIGDEQPINITVWSNLIRAELKKRKLVTLPVLILKIGSYIGDFLQSKFRFKSFPLNTFRYKNMTTDNIINNVKETNSLLINNDLIDFQEGIRRTLIWINNVNK